MLIIVAWGIILLAFATRQNEFFNHDFLLGTSHYAWGVAVLIFLVSWQLMTMAMMLPSVLPLLARIEPASTRRGLWASQASFIGGYALPWTAFALLAFLNDTLLHWLVARWWWLYFHAWVIGAALLVIAGCFQLSPFKARCLQQCCRLSRWCASSEQADERPAWQRGIRYGCYCVGSCWAMMLALFGLGMNNLLWMAVATVAIAAEKVVPCRRGLVVLLAGVFFLGALLWYSFSIV
jgi:predicted metal-binding membrane protein